jgi:lipoprotein-anchoring transpeptidase ErfK/SrfK
MDSLKTPLGWHEIRGKIGENAPWGQVFRARRPTNEIWQYGEDTKEDLVLTRVLLLDGLEPGHNKGGAVDSMARNIYIHGTNDEAKLGTPSSHGCIRLFNDDVIELFTRVEDGALVLITAD